MRNAFAGAGLTVILFLVCVLPPHCPAAAEPVRRDTTFRGRGIRDGITAVREKNFRLYAGPSGPSGEDEAIFRFDLFASGYRSLTAAAVPVSACPPEAGRYIITAVRSTPQGISSYRAGFNSVVRAWLTAHPEECPELAAFLSGWKTEPLFPIEKWDARELFPEADGWQSGGEAPAAVIPEDLPCLFTVGGKWAERYGYLSAGGEVIVPPVLRRAFDFSPSGLAIFQDAGCSGAVGSAGQVIIEPARGFQTLAAAGPGRWFGTRADGTAVLMDALGRETDEDVSEYYLYYSAADTGLVFAMKPGWRGWLLPGGEEFLPGWHFLAVYQNFTPFPPHGAAAAVKAGGADSAARFYSRRLPAPGSVYIINEEGTILGGPWDAAGRFSSAGTAVVRRGESAFLVSHGGEELFTFPEGWEPAESLFANAAFPACGLLRVVFTDPKDPAAEPLYGFISEKGDTVIPPQYGWADDFSAAGLAPVKAGGLFGAIDTNGEMVIPPIYSSLLSDPYHTVMQFRKKDQDGPGRETDRSGILDETGREYLTRRVFTNGVTFTRHHGGLEEYRNAAGECILYSVPDAAYPEYRNQAGKIFSYPELKPPEDSGCSK